MPDDFPRSEDEFEDFQISSEDLRKARGAFDLLDTDVEGVPARVSQVSVRDDQICELRSEGLGLGEIGQRVGLTRERVRQILVKRDGPTAEDARAAVARMRAAEERKVCESIRQWLLENGPADVERVANLLGLGRTKVRRLWPSDLKAYLISPGTAQFQWKDDEVVEALRTAATYDFPLRKDTYESLIRHGEIRGPSGARLIARYGSWRQACELAGVEVAVAPRDNYQSNWTDDDLLSFARLYLKSEESAPTYAGYDSWQRGQRDAPSGPTLRNRLGTWATIKSRALREVE